jgi:ComF family protein
MVNIWPILDHITGAACQLCGSRANGLCGDCLGALPRNRHHCRGCALPLPATTPPDVCCARCQRTPLGFSRVIAPLLYTRPVDTLITQLKYHGRLALGTVLADCLVDARLHPVDRSMPLPQALIPVPMHAARLRERGFNHAAELARAAGRRLGVGVAYRLVDRSLATRPQQGLSRTERLRNLQRAFRALGPVPAHVAIIDDVLTTGSTVRQLDRVLRANGAETVEVWAVARTPPRDGERD